MARTVVAITGASSGIGAAFARKLALEHDLLLIARRKDRLEQLASDLKAQYQCAVEVMQADLTSDTDLVNVAERLQHEEHLVLLINNAGFGTEGYFWEAPLSDSETMHRLHIMATLRLTHAALRNLTRKNEGAVINVSSVAAWARRPRAASYSATKSWMNAFTEGLCLDLHSAGSNVFVQALCPGFTVTEFHDAMGIDRRSRAPQAFWLSAEEVVDASLNGLRRRKLFVIPGWRYRLLTALISKIPTALRVAGEKRSYRQPRLPTSPSRTKKQIDRE